MADQQTPCPDRILDDCGSAFCMGAIGGSIWHAVKGYRNSPRGDRLRGGFNAMTLRGPTAGGAFAVWGGLFATFDCTYTHLREKEDPWNAIAAGATTGGVLACRSGWKSIGKNALVGGILLGMFEGINIMMQKMLSEPEQQHQGLPTTQQSNPSPLRTPVPAVDLDDEWSPDFAEDAGDFGLGFEMADDSDMHGAQLIGDMPALDIELLNNIGKK